MTKNKKALIHFIGVEASCLFGAALGVFAVNPPQIWFRGLLGLSVTNFAGIALFPSIIIALLIYSKISPKALKVTLLITIPILIILFGCASFLLGSFLMKSN